jgi:hypothetical protein
MIFTSQRKYSLRRFPEYEARLKKYGERGFYIVDPHLKYFDQASQRYLGLGEQCVINDTSRRGGKKKKKN